MFSNSWKEKFDSKIYIFTPWKPTKVIHAHKKFYNDRIKNTNKHKFSYVFKLMKRKNSTVKYKFLDWENHKDTDFKWSIGIECHNRRIWR